MLWHTRSQFDRTAANDCAGRFCRAIEIKYLKLDQAALSELLLEGRIYSFNGEPIRCRPSAPGYTTTGATSWQDELSRRAEEAAGRHWVANGAEVDQSVARPSGGLVEPDETAKRAHITTIFLTRIGFPFRHGRR